MRNTLVLLGAKSCNPIACYRPLCVERCIAMCIAPSSRERREKCVKKRSRSGPTKRSQCSPIRTTTFPIHDTLGAKFKSACSEHAYVAAAHALPSAS